MRGDERFGGGPLQKRARFLVDRLAEKVVGAGIADVELDRRVELDELDEIGGSRRVRILGRPVLTFDRLRVIPSEVEG